MNVPAKFEISLHNRTEAILAGDINRRGDVIAIGQIADVDPGMALYDVSGDCLRLVRRWAQGVTMKSVSFSPDGKTLACVGSGMRSAIVGMYDLERSSVHTHETRLEREHAYWCKYARDRNRLVCGVDDRTIVWDGDVDKLLWTSPPQQYLSDTKGYSRSALSSDGELVAVTGTDGNTIVIYRVDDGSVAQRIDDAATSVKAITFDDQDRRLAIVTASGALKVWNLSPPASQLHPKYWTDSATRHELAVFLPDDRNALAQGAWGGSITFASLSDTLSVWESPDESHDTYVTALSIDATGRRMLSAAGRKAVVWEIR